MKLIPTVLSALALFAPAQPAHAASSSTVRAVLIMASNAKSSADPRLAAYETELQRNLPESSFRFVSEGTASLPANGSAKISLGGGHRVELTGEGPASDGVRLKIQWMNGGKLIVGGTFTLPPGIPVTLLQRPKSDGDIPIVVVVAR